MIEGSIVALVTPMHEDGAIDWHSLDNLLEMHVAAGTNGIVAMGTTGESATLDVREHCAVIERVVDVVAGRTAVIAGTGANSTREAVELTKTAKALKADACLLVAPYYNKPTQEGLYLHFKMIADTVSIPQYLYNVPGRCAVDIHNETALRLASIDNIVGIKDATGDVARGKALIELCGDQLDVFSGDDETFLDLMRHGARGNISVTANVAPVHMAKICRAALAGDFAEAVSINDSIKGLHKVMFCQANPIPVKWALYMMGHISKGIRLPLTMLSTEFHEQLKSELIKTGVIE